MNDESGIGSDWRVVAFGIYLVVLNLALISVLVRIWPGSVPPPSSEEVALLWRGWLRVRLALETRYLVIVAVERGTDWHLSRPLPLAPVSPVSSRFARPLRRVNATPCLTLGFGSPRKS